MPARVATAVWALSSDLILALDAQLGPPVDSYVNGSQTWLTDNGPGGMTLEWRLHPVSGYRPPKNTSHYDIWETVVHALSQGSGGEAISFGPEARALGELWEGLECYAAYGDDLEPATLRTSAIHALGIEPGAAGLADHEAVADAWEHANGKVSIVALLLEQLNNV